MSRLVKAFTLLSMYFSIANSRKCTDWSFFIDAVVSFAQCYASWIPLFWSLLVSVVSITLTMITGPHQFPPLTAVPTVANHGAYSPSPAPGPGDAGGAIPGGSSVSPSNGPAGNASQAPAINQPCRFLLIFILSLTLSLRMWIPV